jgi:ABC-type nitrate/sulfonate/bicarbonate transport system permease component
VLQYIEISRKEGLACACGGGAPAGLAGALAGGFFVAPTIFTGMRISIGIAWLVIVAAEMLVGGTGIGYFVWNEWNNLSITNVIIAILLIGVVGMLLDQLLARAARAVTFPE